MHAIIPESTLLKTFAAVLQQCKRPGVIAICGAADLGKSTLAKKWATLLSSDGVSTGVLSTDSFLMDRDQRKSIGLSGYHPDAFDSEAAMAAVSQFLKQQPFEYHKYEHDAGRKSETPSVFEPSDLMLLEGIHSMNLSIASQIDFSVFVYAEVSTLKKLRKDADLKKRGQPTMSSNSHYEEELAAYRQFIEPEKFKADCSVEMTTDWEFLISCNLGKID